MAMVLHEGGAVYVRRRVRGAAYVFQGAVEHYGWLSAPDDRGGLALGETTPARSSWSSHSSVRGRRWPKDSSAPMRCSCPARLGACVATFFTFLPSFMFILAGGPFVERTHGNLRFTAPLTAITAAVVGVIVNLAVFFALHVYGRGPAGAFDVPSPVIGLARPQCALSFQGRRDTGGRRFGSGRTCMDVIALTAVAIVAVPRRCRTTTCRSNDSRAAPAAPPCWSTVRVLEGNPLGDPHVRQLAVWLPPQYDQATRARGRGARFPVLFDLVGFTGSGLAHIELAALRRERARARRAPRARAQDGADDHRVPRLLHGARRQPVRELDRRSAATPTT